jgi:hypothetical protein
MNYEKVKDYSYILDTDEARIEFEKGFITFSTERMDYPDSGNYYDMEASETYNLYQVMKRYYESQKKEA